ncbi:MAG: NAD-dependent epimerase/dehydratase family protein, partial [Elusimicrobia bacterium]|nr:NAD-dependent epimerase/dehydratase family protein [Elusimicrobiota bacterium]
SGFLAAPLLARLAGRARVVRLSRRGGPGLLRCDLSDPSQALAAVRAARPGLVYHFAGDARAPGWDAMWRAHVTATVNLFEALAALGAPVRVVVSGSSAEYGLAGGARRVSETSPLEPLSLYGRCKLAQSLAALSFSRGPLEVVVARIFNVLGPGTPDCLAPGAFARQIARVAEGRQEPEVLVGDLSPRRDYVDVRDVAAALELMMRRGAPGESYIVGRGRSIPMRSVLRGMAAAAGVSVRERADPSRRGVSGLRDLVSDPRKLRALGWAPRIPLARSFADTVGWWRGR